MEVQTLISTMSSKFRVMPGLTNTKTSFCILTLHIQLVGRSQRLMGNRECERESLEEDENQNGLNRVGDIGNEVTNDKGSCTSIGNGNSEETLSFHTERIQGVGESLTLGNNHVHKE